jgi:uncharacterized protein (TIGR03000 family)
MYSVVLAATLLTGGAASSHHGYYGGCLYDGPGWGYQAMPYGCFGCHGCYGSSACYGACGWQGWYGNWGGGAYGVVAFNTCCGPHISPYLYCPYLSHPWNQGQTPPIPQVLPPGNLTQPSKDDPAKPAPGKVEKDMAVLNVEVEADARLYINGRLMQTPRAQRSFDLPGLEKGKTHRYVLRAEVERGGKTRVSTQEVLVRAGEPAHVSFLRPTAQAALTRGRLVVEVATDVKLYVNGRAMDTTGGRRTFLTPALPEGKTCTYTVRGEAERDGKRVTQTRKVAVKAGAETRVTMMPGATGVAIGTR